MTLKVVTWYFKMADLVEQDERDLGEQVAIIACLYVLTKADYIIFICRGSETVNAW